jgi:hypothetical protein
MIDSPTLKNLSSEYPNALDVHHPTEKTPNIIHTLFYKKRIDHSGQFS